MPNSMESPYKGSGQLTREQFLFYEMRTTARLLAEGLSDQEVKARIIKENLFQYPTEKSVEQMARVCIRRLKGLQSVSLISAVAEMDSITAKQICLYAMMKDYTLIRDFMITVIGGKYSQQDLSCGRRDITAYLLQLQEQDDYVASWAESTVKKIVSVITKLLVENEYIDNWKADRLNPVLLSPLVEDAIRENGDDFMLPAFNCLD